MPRGVMSFISKNLDEEINKIMVKTGLSRKDASELLYNRITNKHLHIIKVKKVKSQNTGVDYGFE